MKMGERPNHPTKRHTSRDFRVFIDIQVVVEVNELEMNRLPENGKRDCRQEKADAGNRPAVGPTRRAAFGVRRAGVGGSWHLTRQRIGSAGRRDRGVFVPASTHGLIAGSRKPA